MFTLYENLFAFAGLIITFLLIIQNNKDMMKQRKDYVAPVTVKPELVGPVTQRIYKSPLPERL